MYSIIPLPPLPARDPDEPHRAATQLELFFDLVSVIAIAAVTAGLHHAISEGHGLEKLPAFMFLFTAIWWAWMNFTWFASAFDSDGPVYRILVMTIMAGELIFAGGAAHMFETLDLRWGVVGWTVMRAAMATLWLRASMNTEYRKTCLRYAAGIMIAQACWIVFFFVAPGGSALFYGLGVLFFLVEFAVPVVAERVKQTPFHRHHMIERYGLLTIISLGEIMLAISLAFGTLHGGQFSFLIIKTAASALVIVFAVFWLYFCEREHLPKREFLPAFVWGYGHVFIFASLALLGAGIAGEIDLVAGHSSASERAVSWWLGAPLAVFFLSLWVVRDRHFDIGHRHFALPIMALWSVAAAAIASPSWAFAAIALIAALWRMLFRAPPKEQETAVGEAAAALPPVS